MPTGSTLCAAGGVLALGLLLVLACAVLPPVSPRTYQALVRAHVGHAVGGLVLAGLVALIVWRVRQGP